MNYLINVSSYLVDALFNLALYAVLLRFWMQWVRADFRNPIGQFLITTTNPIIIPLRAILPSVGALDTSTAAFAVLLAATKTGLIYFIGSAIPPLLNLFLFALVEVMRCSIYLFLAAIIVGAIASWINPHSYHPLLSIASAISRPVLDPFRRLIPNLGGLDISPIFALLTLQIALGFLDNFCRSPYHCFT